jgi:hypothetical protein
MMLDHDQQTKTMLARTSPNARGVFWASRRRARTQKARSQDRADFVGGDGGFAEKCMDRLLNASGIEHELGGR